MANLDTDQAKINNFVGPVASLELMCWSHRELIKACEYDISDSADILSAFADQVGATTIIGQDGVQRMIAFYVAGARDDL